MASNEEPSNTQEKQVDDSTLISARHHQVHEIAAVIAHDPYLQRISELMTKNESSSEQASKDLKNCEISERDVAQNLLVHREYSSTASIIYEIEHDDETTSIHKPRPYFYKPLRKVLKHKSAEDGLLSCNELAKTALKFHSCTPVSKNLEKLILDFCETGTELGMSWATQSFLLSKIDGIRDFEDEAVFKRLLENNRSSAVGYILDQLDCARLDNFTQKYKASAASRKMLTAFHSRLSSYVLANDTDRGHLHAIICYNDFKDSDKVRYEALEEATSMKIAMEKAGIRVQMFPNWSSKEIQERLKQFAKEVRDDCSAVFVCVMSHGNKGSIFGNNNEDDVYSINQALQVLEQELLDCIPKVIINN